MSKKLNFSSALAILLLGIFSANVSQAQTTWDNTGTEWTSGTSWVGDVAPGNSVSTTSNIAVFSNAAVGFNTVNLSSDRRIYGVLFAAGANAYTFTGSSLTINGAYGITNSSSNLQTFSNKVINASGNATYGSYNAGGSLVFAGGIDLTDSGSTSNRTLTLGGSGNTTVSGTIANGGIATAGAVTIASTALTTLSGNNTYGGATTVSSGATLRLGSATALGATGSGTGVSGGGALDLNGQTIDQEALSISGTGVSSSGSLFNSSSGAASWSGNIIQTAAAATIKATNGSITLSGGIDLGNSASTARTLTLDGTGGIVLSGNIANSLTNLGALTIAATARNVTLSGSNSYGGITTLDGGGMNINSANAISTNTLVINTSSFLNNTSGGAITNQGNNNITLGDTLTYGTSGSTAANSLNLGTGTVTASSSRTITIAGTGVTLGLGTLDSTSISSARTFTANGEGNTLSLTGWKIQSGSTTNVNAKLAGSANWTITGPIVNGNAFSNGVQIDATGLTTFGGNNTYDGATSISTNATLRITSATGLGSTNTGTTVSAGGQLQLSGGITVNAGEALSLSGTDGSTATLRNISGDNIYNGAITFNSGTNRINSDAGTLTLSSFANTLASTRSLLVGGAGDTIFAGRVSGNGSGSLVKDGLGTLTLANTNNEVGPTGVVLINNGTLALGTNNALSANRAVVVNGGTLNIGGYDNTVGAVTLTNGTIAGTTGVLTGSSYAVESGTISAILGGSGALNKSGLGTVTLSGSNSYSGNTVIASAGVLKLQSTNSLSKNSSLLGASSSANTGTLDLNAEGNYVANSYGTALTGGFNMNFTNSSGIAATLTFTNGENYLTIASNNSAGRALNNSSSNLDIKFNGNLEIGSTALNDAAIEFAGAGNFRVDGAIKNSGSAVRGLLKTGNGTLTLAGTNNNYNGTTAVKEGTLLLTNNATLTGSTALTVSTTNTVSSSSATRTAAATLNVASGSTLRTNSTTTVYSGGNLIVNGTAGAVDLENNGLLGGSGAVGSVNLKRGAFLNPGNSPGLLTASEAIWAAGSTYNWETLTIPSLGKVAGTDWDLFSVTGALNLSALSSGDKMNLVLNSLSLAGFNASSPYSWVFAQAGSFIGTGLTDGTNVTDLFNITATAFNGGNLPTNGFKVEVGTDSASSLRTLSLVTIPEPSTGSMLGLGLAGLVVTRLLRRKSS